MTTKERVIGHRIAVRLIGCGVLLLAACAPSPQVAALTRNAVADGQLFCATTTAAGPLVVAIADAAGAPVSVVGKTSATVAAVCAAVNAIPVVPPPNPAAAPVVAVAVPPTV